jgi:formylglycine-generating enzyme required for sulfatase activity
MLPMVRAAVALLFLVLLPPIAWAQAEKRIGLIITNQAYSQAGARLTNTHRDGEVVKAALEKVGFKVWVAKDTTNERALLGAVAEHVQRLAEAGPDAVGFFYYSGHGAADRPNGENFLIPTDVPLTQVAQLPLLAVRLERITSTLATAGRMSFVVFDACRNVPLQRETKDLAFKGFAPVREQNGLLVAFATEPGNVAVDQSLYAKSLAEEIVKPGLEAAQVFRRVRLRVREDTRQTQSPEYLDKRDHDFHFATPLPRQSEAERTWPWVKDSTNPAVLENFIKQFGDTPFGGLARERLMDLKKQQIAVAEPPKTPSASPPPAPAAPPPDVEPAKAYVVQISSQRSRAEAITSISAFQKKYAQTLAGRTLGIQASRPDAKGVWYRAVVGPPMSFDAANRICTDLKTAGGPCAVTPFTGTEFVALGSAELQPACDGVEALVANTNSCLKPKDSFKDCPECPTMVVVPAGEFLMGSPSSEPERHSGEVQLPVSIGRPFAVGKFAVTRDEWEGCVADRGCNGYRPPDLGLGKRPVVLVNWDHAKAFTTWLSLKTGKTYRLLSEAEREYVTRAGTTTPYWWGSSISPRHAHYAGDGSQGTDRWVAMPVDSFMANPWGFYNLNGNVREWTEDCWNESNKGQPGNGSARTASACRARVVRGGSFDSQPSSLRAAYRNGIVTDLSDLSTGFRVARTLD